MTMNLEKMNMYDTIEMLIEYDFKNRDLLLQALTRKTYSEENGGQNNEVLEFIGDKVIDLVVIKEMMKKYGVVLDETVSEHKYFVTQYGEGKFTDIKKYLTEGKTLAEKMSCLGFTQYLRMGKGDIVKKVDEEKSVKEDLFEAIVGAVAIDSNFNFNELTRVVNAMLDLKDMLKKDIVAMDYVTQINNLCNQLNHEAPNYTYTHDEYDFSYCKLNIPGIEHEFKGSGPSDNSAKFECAMKAYEFLDEEGYFEKGMKDIIGEPDENKAVDQLEKLYQKKFFNKPFYDYIELNKNGKKLWKCVCIITNYPFSNEGIASNKRDAKKIAAYEMLKFIL